jgi:hypothetical protein
MHCDKPSPVNTGSSLLQRGVLTQFFQQQVTTAFKRQNKILIRVNDLVS